MLRPLNIQDRKRAIAKFTVAYFVSVLAIGIGLWVFLRVPGLVSDSDSGRYKKIITEQTPLVRDTDTLGRFARQLIELDGAYAGASDEIARGEARTRLLQVEHKVSDLMSRFNSLAAGIREDENKTLSAGIATLAQVLVTYRQTISELRLTLFEKGIDVQRLNDLQNQINQKDMEIGKLQVMLMAGGGRGDADPTAKELQHKLGVAERSLRDCLARNDKTDVTQVQKQLEECMASKGGKGVTFREALSFAMAESYLQLLLHNTGTKKERKNYFVQARENLELLEQSTRSTELKARSAERLALLLKNEP